MLVVSVHWNAAAHPVLKILVEAESDRILLELAQGLLPDLAHTLTGESKFLAYLLEGHLAPAETEGHPQDFRFPRAEDRKRPVHIGHERLVRHGLVGGRSRTVRHHVEEGSVAVVISERSVNGHVGAGNAAGLLDLALHQAGEFGKFFRGRLTHLLLEEGSAGLADLADVAHLIERQTDYPGLFGYALEYALAYPPYGIRNELEAEGVIELLCGLHKSEVALGDEVLELHALALILLGYRNHEPEVRANQLLKGTLVTGVYPAGEFNFLIGSDEGILGDVCKICVDGIVPNRNLA